jgi:uncharacterized membrane protein YiaA
MLEKFLMKNNKSKLSPIITRTAWIILLLCVALLLVAVVHVPLLISGVVDSMMLRAFGTFVLGFILYSVYLAFAQLSSLKVKVYFVYLTLIISSLWIDAINVAYDIDSCISGGGRWLDEDGICDKGLEIDNADNI